MASQQGQIALNGRKTKKFNMEWDANKLIEKNKRYKKMKSHQS